MLFSPFIQYEFFFIFIGDIHKYVLDAVRKHLWAHRKDSLSKKIDNPTFAYLVVHGSTLLPSKLMLRSSYLDLYRIGEAGTAFVWPTFFMLFVVGPESACLRMDVPSLADWLIVHRRELIFDITLSSWWCCSRSGYATVPHVFRSSDENELLERLSFRRQYHVSSWFSRSWWTKIFHRTVVRQQWALS